MKTKVVLNLRFIYYFFFLLPTRENHLPYDRRREGTAYTKMMRWQGTFLVCHILYLWFICSLSFFLIQLVSLSFGLMYGRVPGSFGSNESKTEFQKKSTYMASVHIYEHCLNVFDFLNH